MYAHRVSAEVKIGRLLTEEEVVHHKDGNKSNNHADNLEVLKCSSDHCRLHGAEKSIPIRSCRTCKTEFKPKRELNFYCCKRCAAFGRGKNPRRKWGTIKHGKDIGYSYYKCRCDLCREAHTKKHREYRARKFAQVPEYQNGPQS